MCNSCRLMKACIEEMIDVTEGKFALGFRAILCIDWIVVIVCEKL